MKIGVNTYKGLNKDVSYDSIRDGFYIDAINMRITTTNGESQASITNFKGNSYYLEIPQTGTIPTQGVKEVIGVGYLRNVIVLLCADDSNQNGWIYTVTYEEVDGTLGAITEKYSATDLFFDKDYPIEVLSRYESDCIQRIYWVDYNNYFRSVNIEDPNLATTPVGLIDVFPNIKYVQPILKTVQGGGGILAGSHQYAYKLITFDGKETLISPPSNMIHAVRDLETNAQSNDYHGDIQGNNTYKSHEITIDTSTYGDFEKIELIHIFHADFTGTAQVFSIETKAVNNNSEITFLHTNSEDSITELDLLEYAIKQYPFKTFKTLTSKDNSLIPANIKGSDFDAQALLTSLSETFDAKTYRYLASQPTTTADEFNQDYNKDAHWDIAWHTGEQFKYQENSLRLGGTGTNISYTFHLEDYIIDGNQQAGYTSLANVPVTTHNLNDGYTYNNTTFDSNGSPFISGLLRGYKRGETYRFGIIFYNKKGEASFVEHIGDIKFPDISEQDSVANNSGETYFPVSNAGAPSGGQILTTAYAMGIEFNIDFSTCPNFLAQIESYQIVRVKRETGDIRRACSGIMKVAQKFNIWADDGEPTGYPDAGDYDLRVNTSEDIVHLFPHTKLDDTTWGGASVDASELGWNANFNLINDNVASSGSYDEFPIYGTYMTFYSPDISYNNIPNVRSEIKAGNAMLLMTGRYKNYYSSIASGADSVISMTFANNTTTDNDYFTTAEYYTNTEGESLGTLIDFRRSLRETGAVDKTTAIGGDYATGERGMEYIKNINDSALVDFSFGNTNNDYSSLNNVLGPYNGYEADGTTTTTEYFRNFYAWLAETYIGLNDHREQSPGGGNPNEPFCQFSKGATGLTGTLETPTNDPLTGIALPTPSLFNHFHAGEVGSDFKPVAPLAGDGEASTDIARFTSTPILDILIPRNEVYSGYNQTALEANIFIGASPVIDVANTTPIVFGGDIFLTAFTFQDICAFIQQDFYQDANHSGSNANAEQEFTYNYTSTTMMISESRANIELAWGSTIKTGVEWDAPGGPSGIVATRWRQETNNATTDYGASLNMYENSYNAAYQIENDEVVFFIKPENFESDCSTNDIRAFISDVKVNEEVIDSWTKFSTNNYYDVDDYGPINKVINHKDDVYFFQDKGVGRYSINPRAIVSTDDGIPTELGSGEGFQDHKYFTNRHGAIHQWAVSATDFGIYFYDGIHKKIFKIGQDSSNPLSEIHGIHSLLTGFGGDISLRKENGGDNPIRGKGVHIGKDLVNNEVLFTFMGTSLIRTLLLNTTYYNNDVVLDNGSYYKVTTQFTTAGPLPAIWSTQLQNASELLKGEPSSDYTLVFDEIAQQFSSEYSVTPSIWIENGDLLLSADPDNRESVYRHNHGNYGEFYGTVQESSITMVLNKEADINKILRFVEFNSIVRDNDKSIDRDLTITDFKVETEYQTTNKINISSDRIKRRFDKWRLKIPRNQTGTKKDRLRSTHFVLTLYFDNTYNKELILNRVHSYFDIQVY